MFGSKDSLVAGNFIRLLAAAEPPPCPDRQKATEYSYAKHSAQLLVTVAYLLMSR